MENFENIRLPWPEWEIVKYLGGGAYGKVYEIERNISGIQEKAALKIVSRPKDKSEIESYYDNGYDEASIISSYESEIRNYIKEYKLMKELQGQSNIVSCDDFKVVPHENGIGGDIFIRMELLTSLAQVLRKKEKLSEQEIIKLGKDISHALILCESKNIIHRDIKPANIMVSQFGDYKLGDFGVSKIMDHTTYATKMGTQEYQAPEVVHMEKYGHTADIYSLGITLYWLLNNRRMPFIDANGKITAELKDEAMDKRYRGEKLPAPKNGSDELKRIVLKACAYRPENRYASAQEMYDALDKIGIGYSTISSSNPVYGHPSVSSFEDDWMESGETIGKTVDDLSGRQTEGNSWGGGGTIGRTIGKLKGNTEKKQKEVQEEPKTIGVKKAYQEQKKKVEEAKKVVAEKKEEAKKAEAKKVVTAESKPKKVKKTTFGYVWNFLVIGFCVFLTYEIWIKEGFGVLVREFFGDDQYDYVSWCFLIIVGAFTFAVLPRLGFCAKEEDPKNADGYAVALMGGRLALVFLNIIGFGDLGIGVKIIVVLLILGFLFICWKVGTEIINRFTYVLVNEPVEKSDDKSKIVKYKWGKLLAVVAVCICGVLLMKNVLGKDGAWDSIVDYSNYKEDTDDNGNVIQRTYYYGNGKVGLIEEYDENENLTKETDYDTDGKVNSYRTCEYDEKGNWIKETNYDGNDKVSSYSTYEHDENGNLTKETDYDADGKVSSYRTYECDEKGNWIKVTDYDEKDKMSSYCTYEYDEKGNQIKETDYDENNNVTAVYEREYDENGNQVKWTEYDSEGQLVKYCIYEYNSDNEYKKDTTYDSEGNVIGYTIYGKAGKGKWQKCTSYDADGKSTSHGQVRHGIN